MAGERSKESGEFGEKLMHKVLEFIGWSNIVNNFDINCIYSDRHASKGSRSRRTHGIDGFFTYSCPLNNGVFNEIVISSKYTQEYPPEYSIKREFKKFLLDITQTMECIVHTDWCNSDALIRHSQPQLSGVIFWLSHNKSDLNKNIINSMINTRFTEASENDPVYLVDSKQANFLVNIRNYIKIQSSLFDSFDFYYQGTGYNNNTPQYRRMQGSILPVQLITSDTIPIKTHQQDKSNLWLFVNIPFSESNLKRLVGLSILLTDGWASKIVLFFPNYDELNHKKVVSKVLQLFVDKGFTKTIQVKSFLPDLHSLGGE